MEQKALIEAKNINMVNLETWGDYVAYYKRLDQIASAFSWAKAEVLLQLIEKFGEQSVEDFSRDIEQPRSTVINYVRTARAFPPDSRNENLSFSAHFQASFADSFDDKTGAFASDNRFRWLDKAEKENLSTRAIAEGIQLEKQKRELAVEIIPCDYCGLGDRETKLFVFYSPGAKREADKFMLHEDCYTEVITGIKGGTHGNKETGGES
jgi:hypothetical protein